MFNPKLWSIARYMYHDPTTKSSTLVGLGTGIGLFAGGSGILPALVGVSVAIAAAGAIRGMIDNYRRNNATISQRDVIKAHNDILQPDSNRPVLNQAASYHNAIDSIERYSAQGGVNMFSVGMMRSIDKSLDWAIESASQKNESAQTLQYLKDKNQSLIQEYVRIVAVRRYVDATSASVSQDLYTMVDSVGSLREAIDANQMIKEFNIRCGKADSAQLYESRLVHLQEQLAIIKETAAKGFVVNESGVEHAPGRIKYVMDSIAYMDQTVNPPVPVIIVKKENATIETPVFSNADTYNNQGGGMSMG